MWATPTTLGMLLLVSTIGRFFFWLPTLEGAESIPVSSHLVSLFALPFGLTAVMIVSAKLRTPGPDWQHSHWQHHLRTLVFGAVGGCAVALLLFPAAYAGALTVTRMAIGGAVLFAVSLFVVWRTLQAIRASERKLPIRS